LLVALSGAAAGDETSGLRAAAAGFYGAVVGMRTGGVPDRAGRDRLAPHLSTALARLLEEADAVERGYREATRGEVPPLVEGDLFTSLFEGATAFEVGPCEPREGRGSCTVELRHAQPGAASTSRWKDRIVLVKTERAWVVDDVEYGGDWEFMHEGTLRGVLADVIRDGREQAALAAKEGLLLGGWVFSSGDTDFEQIGFEVEDGRQVFRSWLHERPEIVGDWSRAGDRVTIRAPDGSSWSLDVLAVSDGSLEVRFEGRAEKAVFRRPAPPRPSPPAGGR
jgi:hypothetical protein